MASFSPTRLLSSVDLPTFGRPKIATVPATVSAVVPAFPSPGGVSLLMRGFYIAQMSCYPESMRFRIIVACLIAAAGAGGRAGAAPVQVVPAADGALELRDGAAVLARVPLRTPAL